MGVRQIQKQNKIVIFKSVTILGLVLLFVGQYQNCGNVNFAQGPSKYNSTSVDPNNHIAVYKPALAVRAAACLMCHGQVNGNIITDFGYGDSYFFGKVHGEPSYGALLNAYGNWNGTGWQFADIKGNLYVPKAEISDNIVVNAYNAYNSPAAVGSVNLKKFITTPYKDPAVGKTTMINTGTVIEKGGIYIAAPTEGDILALSMLPSTVKILDQTSVQVFQHSNDDSISGLVVKNDTAKAPVAQNYISNSGVINCYGDIIVLGTLFLDQPVINTDKNGCRLYVSQSVFIQGGIQYSNPNQSNFQVSSARAIVMGFRSIEKRLSYKFGLRAAPQGKSDENTFNDKIITDRNKISSQKLYDHAGPVAIQYSIGETPAQDTVTGYTSGFVNENNAQWISVGSGFDPNCAVWFDRTQAIAAGSPCYNKWAESYMRKTVDFSHVVFNAPKVYSRYFGLFKGAVIAEYALFAVNQLKYEYDPIFDEAPVLPLLNVFSISD